MNRKIVSASIKLGDEIICGPRHYDTLMRRQIHMVCPETGEERNKWFRAEQGFIDQFGNFFSRTEAWKIAEVTGQIFRRVGGDGADSGTLYSENLY